MQKVSRQFFNEIIWLAVSLSLTLLSSLLLFGKNFLNETIVIHIYDTYFVIALFYILLPIFFLVTFIFYFIKEFRNSFRRSLSNWILITAGLALVIALTFLIKIFSGMLPGGWSFYPPLSALGPDKIPELIHKPITNYLTSFLTFLQALILLMLVFATFRWGRQKYRQNQT